MATKIQVRRGIKANSTAVVFDAGEPFFLTDTKEIGMGDGATAGGWLALTRIILSQTLGNAVDLATFDLTSLGLSTAPTMIIPILVKSGSTRLNIKPTGRTWTSTSYTCDLDGLTDNTDYVVIILIIP